MRDRSYSSMMRDLEKVPPELRELVLFYGKLCPGLLMAARLAQEAMRRLGAERHDADLQAVVESVRCHSAAVQWVTGCNSRRLVLKDWGRACFTLIDRHTGRAVRARVKPGFPAPEMTRGVTRHDMFFKLLPVPAAEYGIFEDVRVTEPLPPTGPATQTGFCPVCGERVMDGLFESVGGRDICLSCAHPYTEKLQ